MIKNPVIKARTKLRGAEKQLASKLFKKMIEDESNVDCTHKKVNVSIGESVCPKLNYLFFNATCLINFNSFIVRFRNV